MNGCLPLIPIPSLKGCVSRFHLLEPSHEIVDVCIAILFSAWESFHHLDSCVILLPTPAGAAASSSGNGRRTRHGTNDRRPDGNSERLGSSCRSPGGPPERKRETDRERKREAWKFLIAFISPGGTNQSVSVSFWWEALFWGGCVCVCVCLCVYVCVRVCRQLARMDF